MSTLGQLARIVSKYGLKETVPTNTATIAGNFTTRKTKTKLITPETFANARAGTAAAKAQQNEQQKLNSKTSYKQKEEEDTYKLLKENESLVGKGSKFQRRIVQDMLLPFKDTHSSFRRLEVQDSSSYDVERAQTMYKLKTEISQNETLQRAEDELFLRQVLPLLDELTESPHNNNENLDSNTKLNYNHKYRYRLKTTFQNSNKPTYIYPRDSYTEIPPIPNLTTDPNPSETLLKYTGLLTHTKFHFKNSSSRNGIIPLLLRTLTHPKNETTRPYLTTEIYNNLLWYFGSLHSHDMAAVRETLSFMKISGCVPSTQSYNLVLRALLSRVSARSTQSVVQKLVFYLGEMLRGKVVADEETWNLVWLFLKSESGRVFLWQRMSEVGFGLDIYNLVSRIGNFDGLDFGNKNVWCCLSKGTLKILLRKLLEQEKFNDAWVMLKNFIKESESGIDYTVMDVFLAKFASRGRLDLTLLVFNTLVYDYKVKPGVPTFKILFKSLVWNGYFKNFPVVFEYLKSLNDEFGLVHKDNYWKLKAESIAKYNCTKPVSADDLAKLRTGMSKFKLDENDELTLNTMDRSKVTHERIKTLRYLNCVPYRVRNGRTSEKEKEKVKETKDKTKNKYITTSSEIQLEKRKFRSRIKRTAIQNATVKRIPYAKDWFKALNDELKSRGIIIKSESEFESEENEEKTKTGG